MMERKIFYVTEEVVRKIEKDIPKDDVEKGCCENQSRGIKKYFINNILN